MAKLNDLNILYIHRTRGSGVEGVHIQGLVNAWKSLGNNVCIFSPQGLSCMSKKKSNLRGYSRGTLRRSAYSLFSSSIPEILFEVLEIAYQRSARSRLKRFCGLCNIDFVYERYALFGKGGLEFAKTKGLPFVLEVNYTCDTPLVRNRSKLLRPRCQLIEKELFHNADLLFVVSTFLRDLICQQYRITPEKIIVLPNAADADKFCNRPVNCHFKKRLSLVGKQVIGYVGKFYEWHGLPLLLAAFNIIHKEIPECTLILIGKGPELPKIRSLARSFGVENKVLFIGDIPHDKLPEYINLFDVAVMPDSNEYGSPMKIFEYMALGKAVVAPDYIPIRDVIQHGENGLIFSKRSAVELAESVMRVLNNRELQNHLGRKARESIEVQYNWNANAKKVIERVNAIFR